MGSEMCIRDRESLRGPPSAFLSVTSGGAVATARRRLPAVEDFLARNATLRAAVEKQDGHDRIGREAQPGLHGLARRHPAMLHRRCT